MMIIESITLPAFVGITLVVMIASSVWMLVKKKEGRWAVALFTLFIVTPMGGMMGCIMSNLFGIISVPQYTVSRCEDPPLASFTEKYVSAEEPNPGKPHWTKSQNGPPQPKGPGPRHGAPPPR